MIKFKCLLGNHELEPSIIPFISSENGLCRCKNCGFYIAYDGFLHLCVTKRTAYKMRKEFFDAFGCHDKCKNFGRCYCVNYDRFELKEQKE